MLFWPGTDPCVGRHLRFRPRGQQVTPRRPDMKEYKDHQCIHIHIYKCILYPYTRPTESSIRPVLMEPNSETLSGLFFYKSDRISIQPHASPDTFVDERKIYSKSKTYGWKSWSRDVLPIILKLKKKNGSIEERIRVEKGKRCRRGATFIYPPQSSLGKVLSETPPTVRNSSLKRLFYFVSCINTFSSLLFFFFPPDGFRCPSETLEKTTYTQYVYVKWFRVVFFPFLSDGMLNRVHFVPVVKE